MKSDKWLRFKKTVRFGDCDTANVIHFHNLFRWSHEAWEESLELYGISYHEIFPSSKITQKTIIPIINSEGKFFYPIRHGEVLEIKLVPEKINNHLFQVKTTFFIKNIKAAETIILHCSIDYASRKKVDIPEKIELWIEASNLKGFIEEC